MEIIKNIQGDELIDNIIIGTPILKNSTICFKGKNNVLYCEENVLLANSELNFHGDNSVVFLSSNQNNYYLNISIYNNSICYFGKDNYINGTMGIVLSEQKHLIVGNDGLFSFDCWIRTADPHLIYDCNTKKRINGSKSVFLGDHVWIGQHAFLLKGTCVGSGSIIGANALVSGKTVESNACYGGNPAKKIASDIFFTKACVHTYKKKKTRSSQIYEGEDFIYRYDGNAALSFEILEKELDKLPSAMERLEYLKKTLCISTAKNRFFIKPPVKQNKFLQRWRHRK